MTGEEEKRATRHVPGVWSLTQPTYSTVQRARPDRSLKPVSWVKIPDALPMPKYSTYMCECQYKQLQSEAGKGGNMSFAQYIV